MNRFLHRTMTGLALVTLLVGVMVQAASAAKNTASAPGVTPTSIRVALITPLTGAANSAPGVPGGFKARIALQNAEGGVHGRKISYIVEDDQSSPSAAQTAAQAAVSKGVFAVDDTSALAFGAAPYLASQHIPVVGGGYDGPEWTQPAYSNMFSTVYSVFTKFPRYSVNPTLLKKSGARRFAVVGYSISPSSSEAAANEAVSLKQAGFQVPYLNTSLPFGTVNVTSIALQMKAVDVDSFEAPIDPSTELAIITAGTQAGIKWKYVVLDTGYGQSWLTNRQAVASTQGAYFGTEQVPVELHTPATVAEQAALKKYAGYTGVPDFTWTEGWETADLLIKGLEVAGQNPTRASFIANLRKVTNWDAGGLLPSPTDFSKYQTPPSTVCSYSVQLIGRKFVPTSRKPLCVHLISGT